MISIFVNLQCSGTRTFWARYFVQTSGKKIILKPVKERTKQNNILSLDNYLIPLSLYAISYIFFQITFYWSLVHTEHATRNP